MTFPSPFFVVVVLEGSERKVASHFSGVGSWGASAPAREEIRLRISGPLRPPARAGCLRVSPSCAARAALEVLPLPLHLALPLASSYPEPGILGRHGSPLQRTGYPFGPVLEDTAQSAVAGDLLRPVELALWARLLLLLNGVARVASPPAPETRSGFQQPAAQRAAADAGGSRFASSNWP